jgi:hypothetical protein
MNSQNQIVESYVEFVAQIAQYAFTAYGQVYGAVKAQVEEAHPGTFDETKFWGGGYTTNAKGIDTLDSQARRQAVSTFQGHNPKSGRAIYKSDDLAAKAWSAGVSLIVRAGIRSQFELDAAIEAAGNLEGVIRNAMVMGRIAGFGRRVAKAFGLRAKTLVSAGFEAFDGTPLAELASKVAIAQLADSAVRVSSFYDFATSTLKSREEANKAVGSIPAISLVA